MKQVQMLLQCLLKNGLITKLNYRIHTNAIREKMILLELTKEQIACTYASEADILNVALFGQTAKQWREANPNKKGNIRDEATIDQLLVLANIESYNAILITQGKNQAERMILLRDMAIKQLQTILKLSTTALTHIEVQE